MSPRTSATARRQYFRIGLATFARLLEPEAAVDEQGRARNVVGVGGGEERGGLADVLGRAHPAPGEFRPGVVEGPAAEDRLLTRRIDPARLDHVDVDPVRQQLGGDRE